MGRGWAGKGAGTVVAAAAAAAAARAEVLPIPAMMWSPAEGVFGARNEYLGLGAGGVAQSEVAKMVDATTGLAASKDLLGTLAMAIPDKRAELQVVVLFTADELCGGDVSREADAYGSSDGSLAFVKRSITTSPSSVVLPFTFHDAPGGAQGPWSAWWSNKASKVAHRASDSVEELAAKVKAELAKEGRAGPVAVVVMLGADAAAWDATIEAVAKHVGELTGNAYLAVLTGNAHKSSPAFEAMPSAPVFMEVVARRKLLGGLSSSFGQLSTIGEPVIAARASPHIIFGFLLVLVLVLTLVVYLNCMDSLQAPSRWASGYPAEGLMFN